jgi:hypothetical protein
LQGSTKGLQSLSKIGAGFIASRGYESGRSIPSPNGRELAGETRVGFVLDFEFLIGVGSKVNIL